MESTDGLNSGWNLTTNWTVSGGSLGNTVTVESSVSPVDEAALSSAPKSPLILYPPPSGAPASCEITINFLQRYEVRQVYVRSTSRVYEIYYSSKQPVGNEYLCTVRCGIAAKGEAPDMCCTGESSITCLRDSNEGLDVERWRGDNSNYNDDEWVQVKSLNLGAVSDGCTSLLSKNYMNMDFYEATAEISNAEPCISLMLRLLSIQSGGCVYIDEVYVFVDPIDPNSEIQVCKAENSAGSSLLSMLVPSLLQLSRSKGSSLLSEKGSADSNGHQKQIRTGIEITERDKLSKECGSTSLLKVNEQGLESEVANAKAVQLIVEPAHQIYQNPYIEKGPDAPYGHIANVLEQLVSRVSRIEDRFMRFEENMLKPISGIEARLQHVEQQLEALNEKILHSGDQPCKRFLAPEYSIDDLNVNSSCGNKSECHDQGELEPDEKVCSDKLSVPPEDGKSDSESSDQLLPCLTITAPEFSHGDEEEEENPVLETRAVVDSPKAKRQAVSIDDALASALVGFLSSTSIQPQKYFDSLPGKCPDFSNQDKNYEENDSSVCLDATNEIKLSKISSSGTVNYEDPFKEIGKESNDPVQPSEEENSNEARDMIDDAAKSVTGSISSHQMVPIIQDGGVSIGTSFIMVPDECKDLNKLLHTQIESSFHHMEEELKNCADSDFPACEVPKRDSEEDILHDVLAISQPACTLDFGTPILDVKFALQQDGTSKTVLKDLLGDSPESDIDVPSDEGTLKASSQDQMNFIDFDDANQSDVSFAVDVEYCSLQEVLVDPDSEKLQDRGISQCGEGFSGSLI